MTGSELIERIKALQYPGTGRNEQAVWDNAIVSACGVVAEYQAANVVTAPQPTRSSTRIQRPVEVAVVQGVSEEK
jgi:hypothetical protein